MNKLTMEWLVCLLTRLLEELQNALTELSAMLAQLFAQGQAAADELNDLNLVVGG